MRVKWSWGAPAATSIFVAIAMLGASTPASHSAPVVIKKVSTRIYGGGSLVDLQVTSPERDIPMRDIYTWTPLLEGIDPNTLPVVYFLHGWPGSPSSMIAGVTASLIKDFQSGVKPFIAAFPDGNAKTHVDSEWADSSDGKSMIETWLTTNAITAVEGQRIRPRTERAIVGFSMGGYGAAIIALHHPDLFSQVTTLAGYFVVDDLTGAFVGAKKIAFQSPANYLGAAKQLRWYLAEAKDDFTTPIRGQMASWGKKLTALKIPVTMSAPTGGHSFIFVAHETIAFTKWFIWPPTEQSTPTSEPATPSLAELTPSPTP
jgi:S-formylglutathione hydrolase FrmB